MNDGTREAVSIGYVVEYRESKEYLGVGGTSYEADIGNAHVYPIRGDAIGVNSCFQIVPVVVTEEPGPSVREVVELRGTVDLDGLKFALRSTGRDSCRLCYDGNDFRDVSEAKLFKSMEDAGITIGIDSLVFVRIVGIREIPGAPLRRVREITPAMLATPTEAS